jgi:hypothetical protein
MKKISELQLRFDFGEEQTVMAQPVLMPVPSKVHHHLKIWFHNPRKPEIVECLERPERINEEDAWSTQHVGHAKNDCWICARGGIVTAKEYFSSHDSGCWHPFPESE